MESESDVTCKRNERGNCFKKFTVNKRLLPVKAHYLIYNAALSSVLPFRAVYAKTLGVTGTETGVVFAVMPLIMVFTNPLFGAIVDHFKSYRTALYTLLFVVGVSHFSLTFIPQRDSLNTTMSKNFTNFSSRDIGNRIEYSRSDVISALTSNKITESCNISCDSIVELSVRNRSYFHCILFWDENLQKCGIVTSEAVKVGENVLSSHNCNKMPAQRMKFDYADLTSSISPIKETFYICVPGSKSNFQNLMNATDRAPLTNEWRRPFCSLQFWLFLLLIIISNTTHSAVEFLMDAVCYEILEDKPENYGQQRMWGAVGWGTGSLLAGYLNQLFSSDSENVNYTPCFYLLGALILLNLIPLHFIRVVNVNYSKNIMKDVIHLFRDAAFLIHITTIFCIGGLSAVIWHYEFWFLVDLGASSTLLGLTQTVQTFLSELPCFFVAGWICKKIGYSHCNSLAILCFFIRFLAFVPMQNPWLALPVGLLQGPAYGIFMAGMTAYAREKALPGTEATVQACLQVVFEGLGAATGSIIGGIGVDKVGSRITFLYAAIFSFAMIVFNVLFSFAVKQKSSTIKIFL